MTNLKSLENSRTSSKIGYGIEISLASSAYERHDFESQKKHNLKAETHIENFNNFERLIEALKQAA